MCRQPTAAQVSRLIRFFTASRYQRALSPTTIDRKTMQAIIMGDVQDALDRRAARLRRAERRQARAVAAYSARAESRAVQRLYRAAQAVMQRQAALHGWTPVETLARLEETVDEVMQYRVERRQRLGILQASD